MSVYHYHTKQPTGSQRAMQRNTLRSSLGLRSSAFRCSVATTLQFCAGVLIFLALMNVNLVVQTFVSVQQGKSPSSAESSRKKGRPFYRSPHSFNCYEMLFQNDTKQMETAQTTPRHIPNEYHYYSMLQNGNCTGLREMFYWPEEPLSKAEESFPIAFTLTINEYTDQAIRLVNSIYAPQNLYCIHVDLKVNRVIFEIWNHVANCLPNVFIVSKSVSLFWDGYSMQQAQLNCLQDLLERREIFPWKYALTIQSGDVPLRTNDEMVRILTLFDGANDIELMSTYGYWHRYAFQREEVRDGQGLVVEMREKQPKIRKEERPKGIELYKGSTCAALSHAFVQFLLTNSTSLALQQWLYDVTNADEFLYATMNHQANLKAPGGYPGTCLQKRGTRRKDWIMRYAIWNEDNLPPDICRGGWRNSICLANLYDLPKYLFRREFFVNKILISESPVALDCMHELHFNRTFGYGGPYPEMFDIQTYANLSNVVFQRLVQRFGSDKAFALYDCT